MVLINSDKSEQKDFQYDLFPALKKSLTQLNKDRKIDLILLSGDLIDKRGRGFENIDVAFNRFRKEFILPISEELNIPENLFILTPGNHDVDRTKINPNTDRGLKINLQNTDVVNREIEENNPDNIRGILSYKNFEREFYKDSDNSIITDFHSSHIINIDGLRFSISCINSAWTCYESDETDRLIIGDRQISNAYNEIKDCDVKIALMHHHFDLLIKFDKRDVKNKIG